MSARMRRVNEALRAVLSEGLLELKDPRIGFVTVTGVETTTDLQAVADAIRDHDGYVLTTHENPDGDALGSLLATKLAFDALGKDSVMFLAGDMPLPIEYRFMTLGELRRGAAGDLAGR